MKKNKQLALLKYELEHLVFLEKIDEALNKLANSSVYLDIDLPCNNYEMLNLVLDDLGVPPDEMEARDEYNDIYLQYMLKLSRKNEIKNKDVKKLLRKLKDQFNYEN
jgi:hypothetical protein